jgi:hypothetical protein
LDEHPDFSDVIIKSISDESDCENFIHTCSNHLILPAVYLKFKKHQLLSHLPEDLTDFLEEIYLLNLKRNKQILDQVQEITLLLNKHEIFPTFLKGVGNLLDGLYSDPGERIIGDIDLLVAECDYLRAAQILEHEGYAHNTPEYFMVETMKHYPRLYKNGMPADVEIHRLPVRIEYTKMYNTEIIDQEKIILKESFTCYILSDKHKVIHNFIHSSLSNKGFSYGIAPIRDLFDLYLLSKRTAISQTLSFIQHKSKAVTYFLFAGKALNYPKLFEHRTSFNYRWFCIKHNLNLQSQLFYKTNKGIIYLSDQFYKYIKQSVESFYSADVRKSLIKRLSNRQWYENHIHTYVKFFSGKK